MVRSWSENTGGYARLRLWSIVGWLPEPSKYSGIHMFSSAARTHGSSPAELS